MLFATAHRGNARPPERPRTGQVVTASAPGAGKLPALPGVNDDASRIKLVELFTDAGAGHNSRTAALEALIALKDERLCKRKVKV